MIPNNVSSIRILPNDKRTFSSIENFKNFITITLIERDGRYYFPNTMMNCPKNTLVLFQYDSRICAIGVLVDFNKKEVYDEYGVKYAGYYKFDINTITYLENPITKDMLKQAYPKFHNFNQVKQNIPLEYLKSILDLLNDTNCFTVQDNKTIINEIENENIDGDIREALVKIRVNQSVFRDKLLKKYNKCCLCGVTNTDFLVASHIKPWVLSSPREKLDVNNGLLLCPNHDKLFDKGMISFDDNGSIIISELLSSNDKIFLNINENLKIVVDDEMRNYLNFHRKKILKLS